MALVAPPPLPGGGAFAIDFNAGVLGWTRGLVYSMRNPALFRGALLQRSRQGRKAYEHNQTLQQIGDDIARKMCKAQWRRAGNSKGDFTDKYERRASEQTFLAYVADSQGLSSIICRAGNGSSAFTDHKKADVVEAIIGAVYQDCNGVAGVMEDVLRGFGICYPVNDEEEAEVERVWDLARRAYAQRVAVAAEERKAAEVAEAWRQYHWHCYWIQGGSWA